MDNPFVFLLILASVVFSAMKVFLLLSYIKKQKCFCNLYSIVTVMFVFDVDLPFIFYLLTGKIKTLSYYPTFNLSSYLLAYVLLNAAFALFCLGFWGFLSRRRCKKMDFHFDASLIKKIKIAIPVLFFFFLIGVLIDINAAGGFGTYYRYKLLRSVEVKLNYRNPLLSYYSEFAGFLMDPIILFCLILIHNSKKALDKILALLIVALLMLTTFSRGYILKVACIYLIVIEGSGMGFKAIKKRVFFIAIAAIAFFVLYTGIRTLMIGDLFDDRESYSNIVSYSIEKLFVGTLGSSLVGMTRVVHYLFNDGALMFGQSIFELTYRVVPRSIWSGKPLNYGIQTINAILGSPSSTMDAVSLAGELAINFHLFGILLMPFYGFLAAKAELNRGGKLFKYCYAINIFGLATTTMWMGNTGMVSHLINVLYTFVVVFLIFRTHKHFNQSLKLAKLDTNGSRKTNCFISENGGNIAKSDDNAQ